MTEFTRETLREWLGIALDGECIHCEHLSVFGCRMGKEFVEICAKTAELPSELEDRRSTL